MGPAGFSPLPEQRDAEAEAAVAEVVAQVVLIIPRVEVHLSAPCCLSRSLP